MAVSSKPKSNFDFCPVISESSLFLDLQRVKPVYYPCPDRDHGCVLRYCADTLTRPLHKLFTLSLETSDFPHRWKESFDIPLHKKGSKLNACNYRGISKLSSLKMLPFGVYFILSQMILEKNVRLMWLTLISVRRLIL